MNEETQSTNHHVAWADRIGLPKQWSRDVESCSDACGTSAYFHMVRRFKLNIVNIKDGPKLYDMITKYEKQLFKNEKVQIMNEWRENFPQDADNESFELQQEDIVNMHLYEDLYHYIIQLLNDEGFGFYKSKIDEVAEKMI